MAHLKINTPGVVHETVDGEVVIVNLDNGLYFSTDQIGTNIWGLLAEGKPVDAILDWASTTYGADHPDTIADVNAFLTQLADNQLVVAVEDAPEPEPNIATPPVPA